MIFSCIIPCSAKDLKSQKLQDLIASIKAQDFPQDQIEILIETEGDSEQAKANGIRKTKGDICAMFCADNMIMDKDLFNKAKSVLDKSDACYTWWYYHNPKDNSLNRYFSLIGGNDPVCYYLGKNDRSSYGLKDPESDYPKSHGCNGTFYRYEVIKNTDLDHYYPMDNALGIKFYRIVSNAIWHRTSDNLISFLTKRYKYARDLYSDRNDRRWKMVDTREDYWNLFKFAAFTITAIEPIGRSIQGFRKVRDIAWFWHYPVCLGFLITYGILVCRNILKSVSSSPHWNVMLHLRNAFSPSGPKHIKTTR